MLRLSPRIQRILCGGEQLTNMLILRRLRLITHVESISDRFKILCECRSTATYRLFRQTIQLDLEGIDVFGRL